MPLTGIDPEDEAVGRRFRTRRAVASLGAAAVEGAPAAADRIGGMDPAERAAGADDEPVGRATEPALDPGALPEAGAATWTDTPGPCPGPTEVET